MKYPTARSVAAAAMRWREVRSRLLRPSRHPADTEQSAEMLRSLALLLAVLTVAAALQVRPWLVTPATVARSRVLRLQDGDDAPVDAPPAPDAPPARVKLEGTAKVNAAMEKNFGSVEGMQKMGTKVSKTVQAEAFWKNPVVFWSIAGTAALFVPILLYVATKG